MMIDDHIPRLPYMKIAYALVAIFLTWSWLVQKPAPAAVAPDENAVVFIWT